MTYLFLVGILFAQAGDKKNNTEPLATKTHKEGICGADSTEIDRLIQQLGSTKFKDREAATKRLEGIGRPAVKSLRKAAQSADIETRSRAETLLSAILAPRPKAILRGHTFGITSLAFSPDGRYLASGSMDRTIKLWNPANGKVVTTLEGHAGFVTCIAVSPDGRALASGGADRTVRLWDLTTRKERFALGGHMDSVRCVAFSPDGRTMASGGQDGKLKLWDVPTGKETATLDRNPAAPANPLVRCPGLDFVTGVAFAADGKTLVAVSTYRPARLWDMTTLRHLDIPNSPTGLDGSLAFTRDGTLLALAGESLVTLWDVRTVQRKTFPSEDRGAVYAVAFSPSGKTIATANGDNTARIWAVNTGKQMVAIHEHTTVVTSVAFSPDGKTLSTGSYDETIILWDVAELLDR